MSDDDDGPFVHGQPEVGSWQCDSCVFWSFSETKPCIGQYLTLGECTRYPPIINWKRWNAYLETDEDDGVTSSLLAKFPDTYGHWRCGEYKTINSADLVIRMENIMEDIRSEQEQEQDKADEPKGAGQRL